MVGRLVGGKELNDCGDDVKRYYYSKRPCTALKMFFRIDETSVLK